MHTECLRYKYSHDHVLPISRLITTLGNKMQTCTQKYDRPPYGIGLLVGGYNDPGPHIYQTCPSANYFDCKAMAIGAHSQSPQTYLEKHFNEFMGSILEELVKHGLRALCDTLPNEMDLPTKSVSFGIVAKGIEFTILDEAATPVYLSEIEGDDKRGRPAGPDVQQDDKLSGGPNAPEAPADPKVSVAMDTE